MRVNGHYGPFIVATFLGDRPVRFNYFNDYEDAKLYINMVLDWYPKPEGAHFAIRDIDENVMLETNDKLETTSEKTYDDVLPAEFIETRQFTRSSQFRFNVTRDKYKPYVNF